ncbi:putative barnase/colicin E5 family endoribonuclease [Helicobacter sp. T3_23-1056]
MLGGSIAGLEYDENGNATGFSPQNFALGFASGALGSKSLQFLAKKAQTNPKAKALLERIKTKHAKNQSNLATMSNQKLAKGKNMENQKLAQAFGTNYEDFRGQGIKAFNHLSQVKNGFVAGAFYRQDIGDIDLVWGKVWQSENGNIQGYGLSKIKKKHPEITAEILNNIITNGEVKMRKNEATQIFYKGHKVLLKQNWNGESLKNKWIVTAYAKE